MDKKLVGFCKDCRWFIQGAEITPRNLWMADKCGKGVSAPPDEGYVYESFGCVLWEAKDER